MNTIEIVQKSVYGVERLYVVSDHAEHIKTLTRRATLEPSDVTALRELGFQIKVVPAPVKPI